MKSAMLRPSAGRKLLCGGGGGGAGHGGPFSQPPPFLGRRDGRGGSGRGCPTCRSGGGGVNPTSMAQNDTHVALIILTTQKLGGGDYWWKKLFRAKICVPAPSAPTSVLTQNKGPDTEPHFSNPPPPLAGVHVDPPPPPPQSNSQVAHYARPPSRHSADGGLTGHSSMLTCRS